jgi:tyrosyl-tRNA synthetase
VEANAETYAEQVYGILDRERIRVEFNSSWLRPLRLEELLRLTSHYTLARMLERDDFARRFQENRPIALSEFLYPLTQAYDSVALRADVELGGSDQRFNLLVGRAIQERYGQDPQVCLILPLLRGTDGTQKMSKSYDNYVGITDAPEEQYGRTMSIPDELLEEWYRLAAGLEPAEVEAKVAWARREPYAAKRELAARVVEQYHGGEAAAAAARHFDRVHREHAVPESVQTVVLSPAAPELAAEAGEVWLPRLLVAVGLAPSTSQAVRLVEQGAVSVDGEKVTERDARLAAAGEHLLQKGRRHFVRARFEG